MIEALIIKINLSYLFCQLVPPISFFFFLVLKYILGTEPLLFTAFFLQNVVDTTLLNDQGQTARDVAPLNLKVPPPRQIAVVKIKADLFLLP